MKAFLTVLVALSTLSVSAKELTIYSSRTIQLIKPVLDAYESKTGVKIKHVTGKGGALVERLKAEGKNSPADVLITVDAGNLWLASEAGVLAPVDSAKLKKNIPAHLRDPKGTWTGVSVRARTLFYNPDKISEKELSTYADLASDKFKGKLCLRTSKKVYNQSLVASLIDAHGEKKTEEVVRGWVGNLATDVFSSDTLLLKAIASGQCAVGVANTYYYARLKKKDPNIKVKLFWSNQSDRGVHVNVSGAGVVASSKNKAEAQAFIEWLSEGEAQAIFSSLGQEFPANPAVKANKAVGTWGEFKQDSFGLEKAGQLQAKSVKLMNRAGYL